jgi:lysophospholipase L1-like esterase
VHVSAVSIARRGTGASLIEPVYALTFAAKRDVTILPGASVTSDPVPLRVAAGQDLAVSVLVDFTPVAPVHGASFVTSYLTMPGTGNHTPDEGGEAFTATTFGSLLVTGVDVRSTTLSGVVAATGSSVVDGYGSDIDGYNDFPSWLSLRVRTRAGGAQQKTVVNHGLGGTTAAEACSTKASGPSVEQRIAADTLSLPGLTHVIVYAGTNDIAGACTADLIVAAYRAILRQAHSRNVKVLISTITPRASYTARQNAERQRVNAWVRRAGSCSRECDNALDFDRVIRDPENPNQIDPKVDSGDGIHPNGEGYKLIAESIPLAALH